MRTTLDIDEDVMAAVRSLAASDGRSLGSVLSDLARRALAPRRDIIDTSGAFPTFRVRPGAPPITSEMVRAALNDEI